MTAPADDAAGREGTGVGFLLGMDGWVPSALLVFFIVTYAVTAAVMAPPGSLVAELVAWLLVSGAAMALVRTGGDPAPWRWTVFILLAGPVATALVFTHLTADDHTHISAWPLSASTALSFFMCVRGRTGWSWVSLLAAIGICVWWAHQVGLGAGYGMAFGSINLAPQVVGTAFAFVIRPVGKRVFELQRTSAAAVAAASAHAAVLDERDRQVVRLDAQARPLLEQLTDPEALTDDARRTCALVEAGLRDSLRARVLDVPTVSEAAWSARSRGVDVLLLDDHGLDEAPGVVVERVTEQVAKALTQATSGAVTVRILPPGREVVATILRAGGDNVQRLEFDGDGRVFDRA